MLIKMHRIWLLLAFLTLAALMPSSGFTASKNVLILPFNLYAPPEYAYLQEGIMATLSNRFQGFSLPIVPTAAMKKALENLGTPYTSETAQTVGASLGATHAVTGSVTIVGAAVTTAIQLWELPQGTALTTFHASGERPDAVLGHLDDFISQVEREVFSHYSPSRPAPPPAFSETAASTPGPPPVSWQSEKLNAHIVGMAVAELDTTPGVEIALIDSNDLRIVKRAGDALQEMTTIKSDPYLRLIAVDAADIDGSGTAEVFVSAYHIRLGQPRSFVMAWDSARERFAMRLSDLPTYFRVTRTAAGEHRLVGQEKGLDDFFGGLPVMMRWSDGRYLPGEPLALPQGTNLYEFTQGPFLPGATVTTATLSLKKRLQLYESTSEKRWSSDTSYGGSSIYLDDGQTPQNRSKQLKQVGEETIKRYYLHPRMLMEDLDKDGSEDLLVVRNTDAAKGLFRRSRLFTSGRVACLTWQPLGPVAKWETPKVSGHITDIAIGDSDGDGRRELIYTVVAGEKEGLDRRQSYIVTHVLDTSQ